MTASELWGAGMGNSHFYRSLTLSCVFLFSLFILWEILWSLAIPEVPTSGTPSWRLPEHWQIFLPLSRWLCETDHWEEIEAWDLLPLELARVQHPR